MSIKEKIQRIKESLDADAFQDGFLACAALLEGSGGVSGLPAAIQFALSSSYGLCALRTGRFDLAEEYCLLADSMESPPVQSQKNLKNLAEAFECRGKWREQAAALERMLGVATQNANTNRIQVLAESVVSAYLKCDAEPALALRFLRGYLLSVSAGTDLDHVGRMLSFALQAQEFARRGTAKESGGSVSISQKQIDEARQADRETFAFNKQLAVTAAAYCSGTTSAPLPDGSLSTAAALMATYVSAAWSSLIAVDGYCSIESIREFCSSAVSALGNVLRPTAPVSDDIIDAVSAVLAASCAVSFISSEESFPSHDQSYLAEALLALSPASVVASLLLGFRDLQRWNDLSAVVDRIKVCRRHWRSQKDATSSATGRKASTAPSAGKGNSLTKLRCLVCAGRSLGSSFGLTADQLLSTPSAVVTSICCVLVTMYSACISSGSSDIVSSGGSKIDGEIVMCAEARMRLSVMLDAWVDRVEPIDDCSRLLDIYSALNFAAIMASAPTDPCVLFPYTESMKLAAQQVTDIFTSEAATPNEIAASLLAKETMLAYATIRLLIRSGFYSFAASCCKILLLDRDLGHSAALFRAEEAWGSAMAAVVHHRVRGSTSALYTEDWLGVQLSLTNELLRDTNVSGNSLLVQTLYENDEVISAVLVSSGQLQPEIACELQYRCSVLRWLAGGERRTNAKALKGAMSSLIACAKADPNYGPMYSLMGHFYHCVAKDPARATKCYLKALSIDPADAEAGVSLCQINLIAGDIARAIKLWDDVCLLTPNAYWAHATRGRYLLSIGHFEEAAESLQRALEKRSGYESSWYELGLCYLYQRQYLAANRALEKAALLSSGLPHPHVHVALGQVQRHLCLYPDSIKSLVRALSAFPIFTGKVDSLRAEIILRQPELSIRSAILILKSLSDTYLAVVHQRLTFGWTSGAAAAVIKGIDCCDKVIAVIEALQHNVDTFMDKDLIQQLLECTYKSLGDLCMCWSSLSPNDAQSSRAHLESSDWDLFTYHLLIEYLVRGEMAYRKVLAIKKNGLSAQLPAEVASAYYDVGAAVYAQGVQQLLSRGQGTGFISTAVLMSGDGGTSENNFSGLFARANELFSIGVRSDPLHSGCWNGLGLTLMQSNNESPFCSALYQKKLLCFNRACQIDANASAYANLGLLMAESGDTTGARACFSSLQIMDSNPLLWVALGSIIDKENFGNTFSPIEKLNSAQWSFDAFSASLEVMKPIDGLIGHAIGWIRLHDAGNIFEGSEVVSALKDTSINVWGVLHWSCAISEQNHYLNELRHNVELKVKAYLYRRPVCIMGWSILGWSLFQKGKYKDAVKAYSQALFVLNRVAECLLSNTLNDSVGLTESKKLSASVVVDKVCKIVGSIERCFFLDCLFERMRNVNKKEQIASDASSTLDLSKYVFLQHLPSEYGLQGWPDKGQCFMAEMKILDDSNTILSAMQIYATGKVHEACAIIESKIISILDEIAGSIVAIETDGGVKFLLEQVSDKVSKMPRLRKLALECVRFVAFARKQGVAGETSLILDAGFYDLLYRGALLFNNLTVSSTNAVFVESFPSDKPSMTDVKALSAIYILSSDVLTALEYVSGPSSKHLEAIWRSVSCLNPKNPLAELALCSFGLTACSASDVFLKAKSCIVSGNIGENFLLQRDNRHGNGSLVEPAAAVDVMSAAAVLWAFDSCCNTGTVAASSFNTENLPADTRCSKKDLMAVLKWDPTNKNAWAALSLILMNEGVRSGVSVSTADRTIDMKLCQAISAAILQPESTMSEMMCLNNSVVLSPEVLNALKLSERVAGGHFELLMRARQSVSEGQGKKAIEEYKRAIESIGSESEYGCQLWKELGDTFSSILMAESAELCYNVSIKDSTNSIAKTLHLIRCAVCYYTRYVQAGSKDDADVTRNYIDECCSTRQCLAASLLLRSAVLYHSGEKAKAEAGLKKAVAQWAGISLPGYRINY